MHVIGMLQGEFESNANLGDVRALFTAWEKVWRHTRLVHVRAHKGDPANELADCHAKLATESGPEIPVCTLKLDGSTTFFENDGGGAGWTT